MSYQTAITQKGQVTIPKVFRDNLKLNRFRRISIELAENGKEIKIKPAADFLIIAKGIKVKRKINPVKARAKLEQFYERI